MENNNIRILNRNLCNKSFMHSTSITWLLFYVRLYAPYDPHDYSKRLFYLRYTRGCKDNEKDNALKKIPVFALVKYLLA